MWGISWVREDLLDYQKWLLRWVKMIPVHAIKAYKEEYKYSATGS